MQPPLPDGPDPAADAEAAARIAGLAHRARAVPLPPGHLTGWSSLCAEEYGRAMRTLLGTVLAAADALADAGRPA